MARTSLGPRNFVRDKGSSSHWALIKAPGQEANDDNLGNLFDNLHISGILSVLITIASIRRF